jgi:hypothetical protein
MPEHQSILCTLCPGQNLPELQDSGLVQCLKPDVPLLDRTLARTRTRSSTEKKICDDRRNNDQGDNYVEPFLGKTGSGIAVDCQKGLFLPVPPRDKGVVLELWIKRL